MEKFTQILIYIHAILGGVALLSGAIALLTKKGGKFHRKSGMVFSVSMLSSAFSALVISVLPDHENPFLFAIGIFSSYFIITGYRALRFKKSNPNLRTDIIISWVMILTGVAMVIRPVVLSGSINIVLTVFGMVGLYFALRDLVLFRNADKLKSSWLKLHLGKMMGGYISAVTAFVVVNNVFPSFYGWFIPGIIGGVYIAYWFRKVGKKATA